MRDTVLVAVPGVAALLAAATFPVAVGTWRTGAGLRAALGSWLGAALLLAGMLVVAGLAVVALTGDGPHETLTIMANVAGAAGVATFAVTALWAVIGPRRRRRPTQRLDASSMPDN